MIPIRRNVNTRPMMAYFFLLFFLNSIRKYIPLNKIEKGTKKKGTSANKKGEYPIARKIHTIKLSIIKKPTALYIFFLVFLNSLIKYRPSNNCETKAKESIIKFAVLINKYEASGGIASAGIVVISLSFIYLYDNYIIKYREWQKSDLHRGYFRWAGEGGSFSLQLRSLGATHRNLRKLAFYSRTSILIILHIKIKNSPRWRAF